MKIIHTSDIHLKDVGDDRWHALLEVMKVTEEIDASIMVITGDLFDGEKEGEALRPAIQELFSNNKFPILILPGNHDERVFSTQNYFGSNTVIITDLKKPFSYQGVNFFGFPYGDWTEGDILEQLSQTQKYMKEGENVLLYHGELLDAFFSPEDAGSEGHTRYMPIRLENLKDFGFSCVLSGHFHTRFQVHFWDDDRFFVYPGSPVSLNRREKGKRNVNVLEIGRGPVPLPLDTPYFHEICLQLNPFEDIDPFKTLAEQLENIPPGARLLFRVEGFYDSHRFGFSEKELIGKMEDFILKHCIPEEMVFSLRDVGELMNNRLFLAFQDRFKARFPQEEGEPFYRFLLQAMMEVGL